LSLRRSLVLAAFAVLCFTAVGLSSPNLRRSVHVWAPESVSDGGSFVLSAEQPEFLSISFDCALFDLDERVVLLDFGGGVFMVGDKELVVTTREASLTIGSDLVVVPGADCKLYVFPLLEEYELVQIIDDNSTDSHRGTLESLSVKLMYLNTGWSDFGPYASEVQILTQPWKYQPTALRTAALLGVGIVGLVSLFTLKRDTIND